MNNDIISQVLSSNPRIAPPVNKRALFPKADGWYDMDSEGVVTKLGAGGGSDFKEYKAVYRFDGSEDPALQYVLVNTFDGDLTVANTASGRFSITSDEDEFVLNKTDAEFKLNGDIQGWSLYVWSIGRVDDSNVELRLYTSGEGLQYEANFGNGSSDDDVTITIKVYN